MHVFLPPGGPGSGKSTQAQLLLQKHPGWVTVAMGDLLREEVAMRGTADAKWKMVNELMSKGEMVPEVGLFFVFFCFFFNTLLIHFGQYRLALLPG